MKKKKIIKLFQPSQANIIGFTISKKGIIRINNNLLIKRKRRVKLKK